MEHTRKTSVIPFEQKGTMKSLPVGIQNKEETSKKKKLFISLSEKLMRMIKIVLNIANISDYDSTGRRRTRDGHFIDQSDIITLLNHLITPGQQLIGEESFVDLLKESKTDPDLFLNENVKSKLVNYYVPRRMDVPEAKPIIYTNEHQDAVRRIIESKKQNEQEMDIQVQSIKRKYDDEDDFFANWELPRKRFSYGDE